MGHYARVTDGVVTNVIVAKAEFFDTYVDDTAGEWIKTSYNTHAGVHVNGGTPLRKNYAGIGFLYDETRDAFIPPQPYPSWVINEETCRWDAPIDYPDDGIEYQWNEESGAWDILES